MTTPGVGAARHRVGVAGWALPSRLADEFPGSGSQLERYATRLDAVEINSSFYRPHRRATYERWAASVPERFRFAVKMPRAVTHEARLAGCDGEIDRFAEAVSGLGAKRGPILVQLPPSLPHDGLAADRTLARIVALLGGPVVLEPRHRAWFTPAVDEMLRGLGIARVLADPARPPSAAEPGGAPSLVYARLHGAPEIYRSRYGPEAVAAHARRLARWAALGAETWTIFDNTTFGFALDDALDLASGRSG